MSRSGDHPRCQVNEFQLDSPEENDHLRNLLRTRLASLLGLIIPIIIIATLFYQTWRNDPDALRMLVDGPRSPWRLFSCFGLIILAATISFFRWHLLLRIVQIPIRLRDTMRLGFLGQLLTFVSLGQVGGDLFKAVFIAREQDDRRAEAIGTIIVDRLCGLYGLLIVATVALLASGVGHEDTELEVIANGTYLLTGIGSVVAALALIPQVAQSKLTHRLTQTPKLGGLFKRVLDALYLFHDNKLGLVAIGGISLMVHILTAFAVYFAATSLYSTTPSIGQIFVASPIASVAGALPITPGGLGSYELVMDFMYNLFSPADAQGRGIVVASCYRIGTFAVAAIGIVFYWMRHRELGKILAEVESEKADPKNP